MGRIIPHSSVAFPSHSQKPSEFQAKVPFNIPQTVASTIQTIPIAFAMNQSREVDNRLPKNYVALTL